MRPTIALTPEGDLELWFPPTHKRGHRVKVPADARGMRMLVAVLQARADAPRRERKIGTAAAPSQAQVEEWIAKNGTGHERLQLMRRKEAERTRKAQEYLDQLPAEVRALLGEI